VVWLGTVAVVATGACTGDDSEQFGSGGSAVTDADGDGFDDTVDCDDDDAAIYPSAPENCSDGVDNDCDGDIDELDTACQGGGGAGGSGGADGSGGEGGVVVGCPSNAPISGADCAPEGQQCTYGNTCCQCSNLGECTIWECANPDLNAQDVCPNVALGTPCSGTYTPSCFACDNGVPSILVCDLNAGQYVAGEITVCQ